MYRERGREREIIHRYGKYAATVQQHEQVSEKREEMMDNIYTYRHTRTHAGD